MDNKIKVEGHLNLYRDSTSGAIINNDQTEYEKFMIQYEAKKKTKMKINSIEEDLNTLKSDISEIKSLLLKLNERTTTQ